MRPTWPTTYGASGRARPSWRGRPRPCSAGRWLRRRRFVVVSAAAAVVVAASLTGTWIVVQHSDAVTRETRANLRESLRHTLQNFDERLASAREQRSRPSAATSWRRRRCTKNSCGWATPGQTTAKTSATSTSGSPGSRPSTGTGWRPRTSSQRRRGLFAEVVRTATPPASARRKMANVENDRGQLAMLEGRLDQARPPYEEAIRLHRQLADDFPEEGVYVEDLANDWCALGELFKARPDLAGAEDAFRGPANCTGSCSPRLTITSAGPPSWRAVSTDGA